MTRTVVLPQSCRVATSSARSWRRSGRVQGRERLVEEQDRRVRRERASERDPLLLASGQFARVSMRQVREAQAAEDLDDARQRVLPRPAVQSVPDVLRHREMGKERVALKHVAEAPFPGRHVDAPLRSRTARPRRDRCGHGPE